MGYRQTLFCSLKTHIVHKGSHRNPFLNQHWIELNQFSILFFFSSFLSSCLQSAFYLLVKTYTIKKSLCIFLKRNVCFLAVFVKIFKAFETKRLKKPFLVRGLFVVLQNSQLSYISKGKLACKECGQSLNETETAVILQDVPTFSLAPGHQTLSGS